MRRSSEPEERAQFTVAELLARYGEAAPTTGRRHRRAAEDASPMEDMEDAAAQPAAAPVVERNWVGTGDPDLFRSYSPQHDSTDATQPHLNGRAGRGWTPAVGPPSVVAGRVPAPSPLVARRTPLNRTALPDGPVTDQLPRLDPVPVDPAPRAIPERNENVAADAVQAREPGSPLWEWAVMMSQIGIGVVGGAALWLVCEWLWQRIPVVALVVALAVITGLVWVVRRVRCAEDLQTTVIAVLVGLFVTVSPAALLLVGR
jgi:hypothetical protein